MFYIDLFRSLQEAQVRYLVVGGMAMNLHGVPRMTADVDLFVDFAEGNLRSFLLVMRDLGLLPAPPVDPEALLDPAARAAWRAGKHMIMLGFANPDHPANLVEAFIFEPMPFEDAYGRRRRVYAERAGIAIPVVCEEDLIAMKLAAGREQDLSDVDALRRKAARE